MKTYTEGLFCHYDRNEFATGKKRQKSLQSYNTYVVQYRYMLSFTSNPVSLTKEQSYFNSKASFSLKNDIGRDVFHCYIVKF